MYLIVSALPSRTTFVVISVWALLTACASPQPSSPAPPTDASLPPTAQPSPSESDLPTPAPSGFAFSDEAVIGYYESQGFTCGPVQPSTAAVGYSFQSCQTVDADERTLVVGLTTDEEGELADAYASVQGTDAILDPTDALDHLAGFLGATLGELRGASQLEWLAGHLGDEYAEATVDTLTVATYTQSEDDHSRLYLELANDDYLNAPTPSGS